MRRVGIGVAVAGLAAVIGVALGGVPARAQQGDPAQGEQTVLGPGLYVFQTRTRTASCGDDERTGYVSSFYAAIHGVPGSRTMQMQLLNSPYWSSWTVTIDASNHIVGDAFLDGSVGAARPHSHFEITREGERYTGEGSRTYDSASGGAMRRCVVTYDALLRRIDV